MRRSLVLLVQAILVHTLALSQWASAYEPADNYRRSIGNLRPDQQTGAPPHSGLQPYRHGQYGHYRRAPGWRHGPYWPHPYPPYCRPYWYPAPLYIPAEELYGPQAVKRFLGLDPRFPFHSSPRVIVISKGGGDTQAGSAKKGEKDKEAAQPPTRERSLNLAWRYIGFGDAHFVNQRYADAYQRYMRAIQAAPTLADAHFRQAYVLIALARYEQAAKALKQGLDLDPGWARSEFRNDELYADNRAAKAAHLDALAQAAVDQPDDADLLFLVGVFLHFDGQKDRSKPFFEGAARLVGADDAHLKGFLEGVEPAREW